MIYLFVAPKLVKKPAGEPPRSGSNAEQMAVAQVEAQMMAPAPTTTTPFAPLPRRGLRVFPEGGRGPKAAGASFGGSNPAGFRVGQAYRGRRRAMRGRRAFRGFKPRNPRMNLFPFANVSLA